MKESAKLWRLKSAKGRLEKEIKALMRTKTEMASHAAKGSMCDKANLHLVEKGLDRAASDLRQVEAQISQALSAETAAAPSVQTDPYGFRGREDRPA